MFNTAVKNRKKSSIGNRPPLSQNLTLKTGNHGKPEKKITLSELETRGIVGHNEVVIDWQWPAL